MTSCRFQEKGKIENYLMYSKSLLSINSSYISPLFILYYKLSKTPPVLCCVHVWPLQSCSILCIHIDCSLPGLRCPWDYSGKISRVFLGIFPTQGSLSFLALAGGFYHSAPPGMLLLLLLSKRSSLIWKPSLAPFMYLNPVLL